jgi:hypothetical protein
MPKLPLVLAALFLAVGALIWLTFLRPVPRHSDAGTIRAKTFKPAGQYVRYDPGASRGMRMPTEIPIAEAFIFEIELDGRSETVGYALNTSASEKFAVDQRVRVDYKERSFGPFWSRVYVVGMEPLAPAAR